VSQDGGCTWRELGLESLGGLVDLTNPGPVGPREYRNIGNVISSDQHSAWRKFQWQHLHICTVNRFGPNLAYSKIGHKDVSRSLRIAVT